MRRIVYTGAKAVKAPQRFPHAIAGEWKGSAPAKKIWRSFSTDLLGGRWKDK